MNSEMKSIFENLNEAIITKTNENIAFCNNIGINILNEIQDYEGNLNFKGVLGDGKQLYVFQLPKSQNRKSI